MEPLPWDTEFFGFPIARVDLEGATVERLQALEEEASALGIVCGYGVLDPAVGDAAYLVQAFGHRIVEVALTFGRPATPFTPRPTASKVRRGTADDLDLLEPAIVPLAPWSRFGADPRFGAEAALRMHRAWVARAAAGGDERLLLVAEDETGVTGVATHVRSPVPRVDIMGVTRQGSGASWALMADFIDWAGGGPVEAGPCAARNISPLRFLEHCGFSVVRTEYRFHRWFDEAPAR